MPVFFLLLLFFAFPCVGEVIVDARDNKTYRTVKIGNQIWMAENLGYKAKGSLCYKDNELNCEKYGRLYDWNTASKACPVGWRLPSRKDWNALAKAAGGEMAGKNLKSKTDWNGTDIYGWSALPGGSKGNEYENFHEIGDHGSWWTSTPDPPLIHGFSYYRGVSTSHNETYEASCSKTFYYSVRCIQD